MASHVFISVVLSEILKAFRMLQKPCLGKADKHPPLPFPHAFGKPRSAHTGIQRRQRAAPCRNRRYLKETKNPLKAPGPALEKILYREGPKGGEGYVLKLSFADQIWELDVLGDEECIARGRECISCSCIASLQRASHPTDRTPVLTELRMRPPAFPGPLWCQTESFHLLSKGALESFRESSASR